MKRLIILIAIVLLPAVMQAQNSATRKLLREGNRMYKKEKYDKAETSYRKALARDTTSSTAQYNLGNSLYRRSQKSKDEAYYDEAIKHYSSAIEDPKIKEKNKSHAYHNRGNSHLQKGLLNQEQAMESFQHAVSDYQEALKIDPKNKDTKYNLSLAKKLLQKTQQQGGGGGDNKDQQDKKDQQQQQQQQNQDQKQQQKEQDKQQQQPPETQKKDAERLLKAMENNEKKTMKEQQAKAVQAQSARIEKDW